ncbi:MAG: hypothetical protein ABJH45_12295 [Paracoccaceae bacterium]
MNGNSNIVGLVMLSVTIGLIASSCCLLLGHGGWASLCAYFFCGNLTFLGATVIAYFTRDQED